MVVSPSAVTENYFSANMVRFFRINPLVKMFLRCSFVIKDHRKDGLLLSSPV